MLRSTMTSLRFVLFRAESTSPSDKTKPKLSIPVSPCDTFTKINGCLFYFYHRSLWVARHIPYRTYDKTSRRVDSRLTFEKVAGRKRVWAEAGFCRLAPQVLCLHNRTTGVVVEIVQRQ